MAMANNIFIIFLLFTINIAFLPSLPTAAYCGSSCSSWDDCDGQLICINGRCNDDPDFGTHICRSQTPSLGPSFRPSGTISCNGETKATYTCSPPITGSTSAILTLNDFSEGGDGGGPSECDDRYHENSERVVALSTGWFTNRSRQWRIWGVRAGAAAPARPVTVGYTVHLSPRQPRPAQPRPAPASPVQPPPGSSPSSATGSRCLRMIRITAQNGRSTTPKVVDECDSRHGCDAEHANQLSCDNNIVDGSDAVWRALGLNQDLGRVPITWSMA